MFFFRRNKAKPALQNESPDAQSMRPELFRIDFDMMIKGSIYKRRKGMIRQFGVTVNGATHLVTSGDLVDRATYEALIVAGAIKVSPSEIQSLGYSKNQQAVISQIDDFGE